MITVIGKRIENDSSLAGGQKGYAKSLISYMDNPVAKDGRTEKCIATMARNFSVPHPSPKRMAAEVAADCSLCKRLTQTGNQGIEHWVISFKRTADEFIPPEKIFKAVEQWVSDMGYGGSCAHKWSAAIHDDTENLHCHIAICRVNALTGKVKKKGWWKNDNQRALARMARENGWHLENEAKFVCPSAFEKNEIVQRDTVTGNVALAKRPRLVDVSTGKTVLDDVALPVLKVKNRRGGTSILPITPDTEEELAPELAEYNKLLKRQMMRTQPEKNQARQLPGKFARLPGPRPKSGKPGASPGVQLSDDIGFWDLVEALGAGVCEFAENMIEPIGKDDENEVGIIKITGKSWADMVEWLRSEPGLPPYLETILTSNSEYLCGRKNTSRGGQSGYIPFSRYGTAEAHRGTKSAETILRERLSEAYTKMEPKLPRMKWGQIHKELAQYGVEMKRRQHKDRYGLVLSLDGKNWSKASDVFPKMSWQALNGHIGAIADSWRDARVEVKAELEAARKKIFNDNLLTEKSAKELSRRGLMKTEIADLQKIPASVLQEVVAADCATALEALSRHMTGTEAMDFLARRFPLVVKDDLKKVFGELGRQNLEMQKVPASQAAYDLINFWRTLQLGGMDISATRPPIIAEIYNGEGLGRKTVLNRRNADLASVLACLPKLVKAAEFKPAPARIECKPVWGERKIGIVMNNIKDRDFLDTSPPNVVVRNGKNSQIIWLVPRKYKEQKFYDDFGIWINRNFGDGRPDGTLMLPGLKNADLIYAKIGSSGQMERMLDEFRAGWSSGNSSETKNIRWQKISTIKEKTLTGGLPEDFFENERYRNPDGSLRDDLMEEFMFPKPKVPPELLELGRRLMGNKDFGGDLEIVAEVLFEAGAGKNEICSILQRCGKGERDAAYVEELVERVAPGYMVNPEWLEKELGAASKSRGRSFFTAGDLERRVNQLNMRGIERMGQTAKTVERESDAPRMGM